VLLEKQACLLSA